MQVRATRRAAAVHYLLHVTAAVSRRGAARGAIGRGTVLERWANEADDVLPTRLGRLRCVVGWVSSFQEFDLKSRILFALLNHHNISRTYFVMAGNPALVLRSGKSSGNGANVKIVSIAGFTSSCQRRLDCVVR